MNKVILGMVVIIFVSIASLIYWHKKNRFQNDMEIWNLYSVPTYPFAICFDKFTTILVNSWLELITFCFFNISSKLVKIE